MVVQVLFGDRGVLDLAQAYVKVVPAGLELLELLVHTVRLVRDEQLRFVDVLDQLHDLVIICFIINIVVINSSIVTPCPSPVEREVARPRWRRGWAPWLLGPPLIFHLSIRKPYYIEGTL